MKLMVIILAKAAAISSKIRSLVFACCLGGTKDAEQWLWCLIMAMTFNPGYDIY